MTICKQYEIIYLSDNKSEYFDLISYPDGQHSIRLKLDKFDRKKKYTIRCRIKNFGELEVLGCLCAALIRNDIFIGHLDFSYLFGIRSDRVFLGGEPNYLNDVLGPIIKHYRKFLEEKDKKIFLDWPFVPLGIEREYLGDIIIWRGGKTLKSYFSKCNKENFFSIGGDQSTLGEMAQIAFCKKRGLEIEVSMKNSDLNKLNDFIKAGNRNVMILDDLCDGGATFIAEGKYLLEKFPDINLVLFVYHGLFTKGFDELLKYFNKIVFTNSYGDRDLTSYPNVYQLEVFADD